MKRDALRTTRGTSLIRYAAAAAGITAAPQRILPMKFDADIFNRQARQFDIDPERAGITSQGGMTYTHKGEPSVMMSLIHRSDEGHPTGILHYYPKGSRSANEKPGGIQVFVHPDHQRKGIGGALLDHALSEYGSGPQSESIKRMGWTPIDLENQNYTPSGYDYLYRPRTTTAKKWDEPGTKCEYCKSPPTHAIRHSEGMAYVQTCDKHLQKGKDDAAACVPYGGSDPSNIDKIKRIATGEPQLEQFGTPDTGNGRWHYPYKEFRQNSYYNDGDTGMHEWHIAPTDAPKSEVHTDAHGREHDIHYDPDRVHVEQGEFRPQTVPNDPNAITHWGDLPDPGNMLWRGMSHEEYNQAKDRGYFQSNGSYNLTSGPEDFQHGKTFFSTQLQNAAHYATGFAPWQFQPTFTRPAHVIGIPDIPDLPRGPLGTDPKSHEVGVPGKIPFDSVTHHWQGNVAAVNPGRVQNDMSHGQWGTPSRSLSPRSDVHWEGGQIPRRTARQRTAGARGETPPPHKDVWAPGETAHYEYHCLQSPESSDYHLWQRSHQPVKVLGLDPDADDNSHDMPTLQERANEGMPNVYRVRFGDGHEDSAWEDELLTHPDHFSAAGAPPSQPRREAAEQPWMAEQLRKLMEQHFNQPAHEGWFHASPHDLPEGTKLVPGGADAASKDFYDRGYGSDRGTLQDMGGGREEHVWLSPHMQDAHFWSAVNNAPHIYEVQPHEEPRPWNGTGTDGWVTPAATITRKVKGPDKTSSVLPWSRYGC